MLDESPNGIGDYVARMSLVFGMWDVAAEGFGAAEEDVEGHFNAVCSRALTQVGIVVP